MSFEVRNEQRSLGQFASNNGYIEFAAAAQTPALRSLVQNGASEDIPDVLDELEVMIKTEEDPDIVTTAKALRDLILNEDLIVITNGVSNEDDVEKVNASTAEVRSGGNDRRSQASPGTAPRRDPRSLRHRY